MGMDHSQQGKQEVYLYPHPLMIVATNSTEQPSPQRTRWAGTTSSWILSSKATQRLWFHNNE